MLLVQFGVQCSLEQMLEDGFYHADPRKMSFFTLSTSPRILNSLVQQANTLGSLDGRLSYPKRRC